MEILRARNKELAAANSRMAARLRSLENLPLDKIYVNIDIERLKKDKDLWKQEYMKLAEKLGSTIDPNTLAERLKSDISEQHISELMRLAGVSTYSDLKRGFQEYVNQLEKYKKAIATSVILCPEDLTRYIKTVRTTRQQFKTLSASLAKIESKDEYVGANLTKMKILSASLEKAWDKVYASIGGLSVENIDKQLDGKSEDSCVRLKTEILPAWDSVSEEIITNTLMLSELLDNMAGGSVRIYVRIRAHVMPSRNFIVKPDDINPHMVVAQYKDERVHNYGAFFSVFSDKFNDNKSVFAGTLDKDELGQYIRSDIGAGVPISGMYTLSGTLTPGKTVVLFGYGLSGSGKTYTLFGTDNAPGVVQLTIDDLQNVGRVCTVESIFEIYGKIKKDATTESPNWKNISLQTTLYELYGASFPSNIANTYANRMNITPYITTKEGDKLPNLFDKSLFRTVDETAVFKSSLKGREINSLKIRELMAITDNIRIQRGRIKSTPLNPTSSRSHLVMIISVSNAPNEPKSRFVIMDLAGKEDPIVYAIKMFERKPSTYKTGVGGPSYVIDKDADPKNIQQNLAILAKRGHMIPNISLTSTFKNEGQEKAIDILSEGVFINETLKQLSYFLSAIESGHKDIHPPELMTSVLASESAKLIAGFGVSNIFAYDPKKAVGNYDKEMTSITSLSKRPLSYTSPSNTFMLPLLTKLRTPIVEKGPETKFIMVCCVRQDSEDSDRTLVDDTLDSLDFANSVSLKT